jgi:hypothetical protein
LIPREQRDHRAAGVEKGDRLAGCVHFSGKAERFVKRNTGAHVADAKRDNREPGDWRFGTHANLHYPSLPATNAKRLRKGA